MKKDCFYCHKEFEKDHRTSRKHFLTMTKFCSQKCKGKFMYEHGQKPPSRKGKPNLWLFNFNRQRTGSRNNLYKHGKANLHKTERQIAMQGFEYKQWRKAVFERDDYTCQWCSKKGVKLNADHIKPWSLYPELRYAIDNGRVLCVPCHMKTPTYNLNQHNTQTILAQITIN